MDFRSPCVLVVDDDADVRESIATALEEVGYPVQQAANGKDALRTLESMSGQPCLVLLDMMMPEMSGEEFLQVLDAAHRLATLPVVVVSAQDRTGRGPRRVLRKPVSL